MIGLALVFTTFPGIACAGPPERTPSAEFELVPVAVFGDLDSPSTVGEVERRQAGGGLLSNPVGIVEAASGDLFILDRGWKKIAVFGSRGDFERNIPFRHGEGPEELLDAIHMTSTPEGNLAILDNGLSRLTEVAPNGRIIGTTNLTSGSLHRAVVTPDSEVWGQFMAGPSDHTAIVWGKDGSVLREAMPRSSRDKEVGPAADMVADSSGRIYLAHRQPGTWTVFENQRYSRRGVEVFPDLLPLALEHPAAPVPITEWPAQAISIGRYADDRVGLHYSVLDEPIELDPTRGRPLPRSHQVDFFTEAGRYLGTADLPTELSGVGRDIEWSPFYSYFSETSGRLFVPMYVPRIAVVGFDIAESSR